MALFGAKVAAPVAPPKSTAGNLLSGDYRVGLILITGSMFARLGAQVRDLQSKVGKLECPNG